MTDVKKRLRNIKTMFKGLIPTDLLTEEQKRCKARHVYSSEDDKYNAICDELKSCEISELRNLQILLKGEIQSSSRLREFKAIIPLAISVFALMYSTASPFLLRQLSLNEEIVKINGGTNQAELLNGYRDVLMENSSALGIVLTAITIAVGLCILIFLYVETSCSRELNRAAYLLEIVNDILEEKKK